MVLSSELSSLRLERDEIMSRCESLSGTVEEQTEKWKSCRVLTQEVEGLRADSLAVAVSKKQLQPR